MKLLYCFLLLQRYPEAYIDPRTQDSRILDIHPAHGHHSRENHSNHREHPSNHRERDIHSNSRDHHGNNRDHGNTNSRDNIDNGRASISHETNREVRHEHLTSSREHIGNSREQTGNGHDGSGNGLDLVPYVKREDSSPSGTSRSEHPDDRDAPLRVETSRAAAAMDLTTHPGLNGGGGGGDLPSPAEHLGLMASLAESRLRALMQGAPLSHTLPGGPPPGPHPALMPFMQGRGPSRPLFQNALFMPTRSPECKSCGMFIADPELLQVFFNKGHTYS